MSTAGLITGLVFLQVIDCTRLLFCLSKLSPPLLSHAATLMLLRAVTFSSMTEFQEKLLTRFEKNDFLEVRGLVPLGADIEKSPSWRSDLTDGSGASRT